MLRTLTCRAAVALVLASPLPAWPIAPDLGLDQKYPFVGECGGGSGTAISPRTMITARHVPGLTFGIAGVIYTAIERINHPTYDIAIFNFGTDLPGWHTLGASPPLGTAVEWVGFGGIGTVNSSRTGYDIRYGNYGRHRASNVVHHKWSLFGLGPALISMLVGNPDAAGVNGDSGGACMADGKLVGVVSYAFNTTGGRLPNYGFAVLNDGVPYHGSGAIDLTVPEIRQWVLANMIRPRHRLQDGGIATSGPPPRPATPFDRLATAELPILGLRRP